MVIVEKKMSRKRFLGKRFLVLVLRKRFLVLDLGATQRDNATTSAQA
jgi:hypothetical protein